MTYAKLLENLVRDDDRYVVMTAENRAPIRTLPSRIGDRFIDTGITEQTLIGMAARLALRGRIPVVHALAAFLTMRAFEFIRTDIGIAHLPVKLVGYIPGVLSEANGPTHQALEDLALMRAIPGMRIFCPADSEDLLRGLREILPDPHPWYIRYIESPGVTKHERRFEIGKSEVIFSRGEIAIISYGALFKQALQAALMLKEKGVEVRLVNLHTLEPLDEDVLIATALEAQLLVTIEDHFVRGGLYSALAELFFKRDLSCPVLPLAFEQRWFKPALLKNVLLHEGFTAAQIAEKIWNHYRSKLWPTHLI